MGMQIASSPDSASRRPTQPERRDKRAGPRGVFLRGPAHVL